jgi:molybdate transport system permease protein
LDTLAFALSLKLAFATCVVLIPSMAWLGWWLASYPGRAKPVIESLAALPLVLPPTVLGYYLLVGFSPQSWLGSAYQSLTGGTLAFSTGGLLVASLIVNIPFALQPIQRAFETIPRSVREAAWLCGLSPWRTFWRVELPLAWPGFLTATTLTFAHTLGEFGVVLMVGGNIPGETRTAAIAIYDRAQSLDSAGANAMAATLLAISFLAIVALYWLEHRRKKHG